MNDENPHSPDLPDVVPADERTESEPAASDDETSGAASDGTTSDATSDGVIPSAHPVLVYTALRVAVLAVIGGILWLLGLRGVYLILLAFLVSGVISAVALSRRREGAAYGITRVVSSANARLDASSRAEDIDDSDDFDAPTAPDPRP